MADYIDTPLEGLRLDDPELKPGSRIAKDFVVYELSRSEVANRLGIDNNLPGDRELRAAVNLARRVMQPIRDKYKRFSPNSVYRCQPLERVLNKRPADWISISPHTRGWACDLEIPGIPTLKLAEWAADHLPDYDEIVCECFDPDEGPGSGWVHIELRPDEPGQDGKNRPHGMRRRTYIRDTRTGTRRWIYLEGLTDRVP